MAGSSPSSPSSTPPALVASVVFGAVGLVVLVAGLVSGSQPLLVCGVAAGVISLIAVLVWREQLIDAWHARKREPDE